MRFMRLSRSISKSWLSVAAEAAQRAVPAEAAASVGRAGVERAMGPAARNPQAVVETTRAERRALESSARLVRRLFLGALAMGSAAAEGVVMVLMMRRVGTQSV